MCCNITVKFIHSITFHFAVIPHFITKQYKILHFPYSSQPAFISSTTNLIIPLSWGKPPIIYHSLTKVIIWPWPGRVLRWMSRASSGGRSCGTWWRLTGCCCWLRRSPLSSSGRPCFGTQTLQPWWTLETVIWIIHNLFQSILIYIYM